jgi:hypothetical protein
VSARSAGVLRPDAEDHVFTTRTVLLERHVTPGQQVESGALLARLITDEGEVANYELASKLRAQAERAATNGDDESAERYRGMAEQVPSNPVAKELRAGTSGWVTDSAKAAPGEAIPAGAPVVRIAGDQLFWLETALSPERMPTVGIGDSVKVLVPGWDASPFLAEVATMALSAEFVLPEAEFTPGERDALAKLPAGATLTLGGSDYPVRVAQGNEGVTFSVALADVPGDERPVAKVGQRVTAVLDDLRARQLTSKWLRFETRLTLKAPGDSLPKSIQRRALGHRERGEYELQIDDVWVEIGRCRLFSRMFSK